MPIALRLNRRRDGSLCLTDAHSNPAGPDREFPAEHGFTYEWLANNADVARIEGDTVTVTLANATAVYRIVNRRADALDLELESSELVDAPPIDEKAAAAIAAARKDDEPTGDIARGGGVRVEP